MFRLTSHQTYYRWPRGKRARHRQAGAQARGAATPQSSPKGGGVDLTRLRNDGTLGEGRKTFPFIVREPPRPSHGERARTRTTLTLAHALALSLPPSAPRMRRKGSGVLACGIFASFPEKFLERRSPREPGGWGAQKRERLGEENLKNPKYTVAALLPSIKPQPQQSPAHKTFTPGWKSMRTAAAAPSSALSPGIAGGGQGRKVKCIKNAHWMFVEWKLTSLLWSCPCTLGPPWLFAALSSVGSACWDSTWPPKDAWGFGLPSIIYHYLGASLSAPPPCLY